jgi:Methionyl-tRNA formyltransferase
MTESDALAESNAQTRGKPDVVLLGDGITASSALQSLVASCNVVRVIRASPTGPSDPVYKFANTLGIPVSSLAGLDELARLIADIKPSVVVISSFNLILPPSILSMCRFVNVHYSLLPSYRGRANVNWAVINGEVATGITIHLVAPALDGGNVLFQEAVPIMPDDTVTSLYERLNAIQLRELGTAVVRAALGDPGNPQNPEEATFGCARVAADGEIDWTQTSLAIDRLIRALTPPFPGAFTHLDMEKLVIARASPRLNPPAYAGRIPGRIVGRSAAEGWVDVLTGDGVMRLFEVAVAPLTGAPCSAAAVIRSTRSSLGLSRLDLLRRITTLEDRLVKIERLGATRIQ